MSDSPKEKAKDPQEISNEPGSEMNDFISFLQDPKGKQELQTFFINLYKSIEMEGIDRFASRLVHERASDEANSSATHESANITPLAVKDLSMARTEKIFSESLGRVKRYLEDSIEGEAAQIEQLIGSKGGFNSQIGSEHAHKSISYLETSGAKHRHELNYSLGVNLSDLSGDWSSSAESAWKALVHNALEAMRECTLKADHVQNDSNSRCLTIKQYLTNNDKKPDEYFSIMIDFRTSDKIARDRIKYKDAITSHKKIVEKLRKKLDRLASSQDKNKKEEARFYLNKAVKEMERFAILSPNPFETNEGVLIYVEVVTTDDYNMTRQQIRKFVENFVRAISIDDPSLQEYEVDAIHLKPVKKKSGL